ncbi:hypothetical protein B9T31_09675 [Acinetobacter sp. ANC 4558]|uniref:DUF6731 family protein n=1 Tax=Acinetobacter sp. ANC 4558 TaxID=1977876 RepID=UPI000A32B51B|nr:DUF6731 family protein [Acinetobacter sp. ANC 4558]OTG85852.1 hypothetical protein B9T31_09675 [Acinetobacter sp. ANC 4558]
MTKHEVNFDFYQLVFSSGNNSSVINCFNKIIKNEVEAFVDVKDYTRELYRLSFNETDKYWAGQFRKYRKNQLPAFARPGEDEIELTLDGDQGIIERNCFIFFPIRNILIWQHDAHANNPERLADFLSILSADKVEVAPILTKSALLRLMDGKTEALKFKISVARPTAPSMYDENKFTADLFSLMNNSGSDLFNLVGGVDLRSKESGVLGRFVKSGIRTLVSSGAAKTAKVLVLENGKREWLDLITDRVKASRELESGKKSIPFLTMVDMIKSVYDEKLEVLNEILGKEQDTLI